jgi:hypothetical protein
MVFAAFFIFALQISTFAVSVPSEKNVSGIVYASSGVPVSGAIVVASGPDGNGTDMTNVNGHYSITEGLKTGNYTLSVIRSGYVKSEMENVAVTVGSVTTRSVYLNLSGGIYGKVTDAINGYGLPNIAVMAMSSDGKHIWTEVTNIAGYYKIFTNLAPGTYNVSTMLPQGHASKSLGPITVTAGIMVTGKDLALGRSGIISGRITDTSSAPLESATVVAISGGQSMGFSSTNATGHYAISDGLGNGTYMAVASYPGGFAMPHTDVAVVEGQETQNIDFTMTVTPPLPSGTITGRVTDNNGQPIAGVHVTAQGLGTLSHGDAYTDQAGNYTISSGLQTDTYNVTASTPGYISASVSVDVTINHVHPNVDFSLARIPSEQSGTISGTVTGDPNPIPEFQYPIALMLSLTLVAVATAKSSNRKAKYG